MSMIPEKVRRYFRNRGSKRHLIWPRQVYSWSEGWRDVAYASPKLHRKHGPHTTAWPVDTDRVQFTDGDIFADFTRSELMESGVAV